MKRLLQRLWEILTLAPQAIVEDDQMFEDPDQYKLPFWETVPLDNEVHSRKN